MRIAVFFAWLAVMALYALSWPLLPALVGDPGKEMPKLGFVLLMMGACSITVLSMTTLTDWIARRAPGLLNIPNRHYWLAPERREASLHKLHHELHLMGLLLMLLFAGIDLYALARAHLRGPIAEPGLWIGATVVWGIALLVLVMRQQRAFALPEPDAPAATARRRR